MAAGPPRGRGLPLPALQRACAPSGTSRRWSPPAAGEPPRPQVKGHAGFKLNALVSPLANAVWGKLAAEFVAAKDDSDLLRVFVNTILAEGWADAADEVDELALAGRVEPFGLDAMPPAVLYLTVGCDVQDDRLEASLIGWARDNTPFVLGHHVVWGIARRGPDLARAGPAAAHPLASIRWAARWASTPRSSTAATATDRGLPASASRGSSRRDVGRQGRRRRPPGVSGVEVEDRAAAG